jgi:hypothetical protein
MLSPPFQELFYQVSELADIAANLPLCQESRRQYPVFTV